MLFPVSGVEVSPLIPPLVAFAISFFTSMCGLSGAFLLLPFQMSVLGYTTPSVSATNQFYNVLSTPTGVYRYIKEKRMVWPLAAAVAAGTLPGVFIGALIRVAWLPDPKPFKLFAAVVLFYISGGMLRDLLTKKPGAQPEQCVEAAGQVSGGPRADFVVSVQECSVRTIAYSFQGVTHSAPTVGVFALSFIVGIVGGTYGIGGGAIIAPFLLSWFHLPVHTISGSTLMSTFLTAIGGVVFYMLIAPFFPEQSVGPDWSLGLLFGLGGALGMYSGACCQKLVGATALKWLLAAVISGTAASYVLGYFFSA